MTALIKRALTALTLTSILTGSLCAQSGQDPTETPPDAEALLERYQRLDRDQRNTVVRNMERRMLRKNDPMLQRIAGFTLGLASYPKKSKPTWYLAADYAPVATKRRLVRAGTTAHKKATRQMTRLEYLPDLHACVTYDWLQGKAVRIAEGLTDDQRFANYVRGYAPGTDHAIATITAALDNDEHERALGHFFEHLYADRMGAVFADVTMFDAWNSGLTVEMPDTDAIAYARDILHTRAFVSPIPADRRRQRLYQRVREGFAGHREYRTLRMAAAAAFAVANPRIDSTYEPLIRRCRWLWMQCEYDVDRFREKLAENSDRAAFLTAIDGAIESSLEIVQAETQALLAREHYMRALAARELDARDG